MIEHDALETGASEILHIAFYKFVRLDAPEDVAQWLRTIAAQLLGSVLVAEEGINGVLAGAAPDLDDFAKKISADTRFAGLDFKRSHCATMPFAKLKIHCKAEIVELGIDGVNAVDNLGINLSPQQWRTLLDDPNVVILDNRNSFEFRLGHFRNAINPEVKNFRDFPAYVEAHHSQWREEGKRVAMYCTGGIRCEKTSAWMQNLGIEALQLEGGILNFLREMPDAEKDWQGACFVFDNRIALDATLHETPVSVESVYDNSPEERWRLLRAQRLASATKP